MVKGGVSHGPLRRWIPAACLAKQGRRISRALEKGREDLARTRSAGETVVFSWIVYKSRAHRDRVNRKVMKDPRLAKMMDPKSMPFDLKRMAYGGFSIIVDL
jgi:hypothetical protein